MQTSEILSYGNAIIDSSGKFKIGQKIDGIDIVGIADQIKNVKKEQAKPISDKIEINVSKIIPTIEELKNKLISFGNAAQKLQNYLGVDSTLPNLFNQLVVSGYESGGNPINNYMYVTPGDNAIPADNQISINIKQLASYDSIQSSGFFGDITSSLNINENLIINDCAINILPTMTLQDVANAINTSNASVSATIIYANVNEYFLNIDAKQIATPLSIVSNSASSSLQIANSGKTQDNLAAKLNVNNIAITRLSNSISDIGGPLQDTMIDLVNTTSGTIFLKLNVNAAGVEQGIRDFVNTYNEVADFILQNKKKASDDPKEMTPDKDAILYGNSILDEILNPILNILSTSVFGISSSSNSFSALSNIGLSIGYFDQSMQNLTKIFIDEAKLSDAVVSNLDGIKQLFGNYYTTSNSNLLIWSLPLNSNCLGQNINLDYTYSSTTYGSAMFSYTQSGFNTTISNQFISNNFIKAPEESDLSGLKIGFVYGTSPQIDGQTVSSTIYFTKGIAELIFEQIQIMTKVHVNNNDPYNVFEAAIEKIKTSNEDMKRQIKNIDQEADMMAKKLEGSINRLSVAYNKAQTIQNYLKDYRAFLNSDR